MEPRGRERHGRAARSGERAGANESNALQRSHQARAFTLIELLVVIAIIAILIGLLFPAFRAVQDQAKRTQAKNDLTQIVNAVNAFYTDYGKYPLAAGITSDTTFGPTNPNNQLFTELRACPAAGGSCPGAASLNTRRIVFFSPLDAKDPNSPRSGIAINTTTINGITVNPGDFVDPWGTPYSVEIDGNYDNQITTNPYTSGAGPNPLSQGVIAWSWGKDQRLGNNGDGVFTNSDDVISWQ